MDGYEMMTKMLLANGDNVDEKDEIYEFTALHYAARFGNKGVAEVLIANGADIKAKDKWDYQPIHWAAYHDRSDIVGLLLSKGADINAKTSLGQTPLQLALERRNTKTVELLHKHGAKEESPDSPI
jgi:ankyrin repeat protein